MYADVSRAYFYAPAVRPVYVRLPAEEDKEEDEPGMQRPIGQPSMALPL